MSTATYDVLLALWQSFTSPASVTQERLELERSSTFPSVQQEVSSCGIDHRYSETLDLQRSSNCDSKNAQHSEVEDLREYNSCTFSTVSHIGAQSSMGPSGFDELYLPNLRVKSLIASVIEQSRRARAEKQGEMSLFFSERWSGRRFRCVCCLLLCGRW